jgi:hypothetical protein
MRLERSHHLCKWTLAKRVELRFSPCAADDRGRERRAAAPVALSGLGPATRVQALLRRVGAW